MQKKRIMGMLLVGLALGPAMAPAVETDDRRLLQIDATAEVSAPNDAMTVVFGIVSDDKRLEPAQKDNAARTQQAMAAIKQLAIADLKIKTSNFAVLPQYDQKASHKINGFRVMNSVQATLEGKGPLELAAAAARIIQAGTENGVNQVDEVTFYLKDREPVVNRALQQATALAMNKAKVLAKAAGVECRQIVLLQADPINEQAFRVPNVNYRSKGISSMKSTPSFEAGEGTVVVKVRISYEIR